MNLTYKVAGFGGPTVLSHARVFNIQGRDNTLHKNEFEMLLPLYEM